MIFQYRHLKKHPSVFLSVTGLKIHEFNEYVEPIIIELADSERERLEKRQNRQRLIGGGRSTELNRKDQILLTLVWLRLYPTNEVLGYLFGVSDSTANRMIHLCLPILEKSGRREITKSVAHAQRKRGYNLSHIFDTIPGLAVIVDAFEQRIERPSNKQEEWYSGKKHCHTIMSQVVVDAYTGEVLDIADSEKGSRQDKGYFNESQAPDRLPEDTSWLGDLGYPGLPKDLDRAEIPRKKPRGKPRPEEDIAYNKRFSQSRILVENTIAQIRSYSALLERDRHHQKHHTERVVAVSGIVNFRKRSRFIY